MQVFPIKGKMDIKDLKIGITLSGGGVRAATFHLGILTRLADENLLEKIKMSSTVSGGSLVTGLIYRANGYKWPSSQEFKANCIPFVKKCLTERNLQANAIARLILWPWPMIWKGRASIFSGAIKYCWDIKAELNQIPEVPRWNINATTIESGKSWRFVPNNRMGDYLLQYSEKPKIKLSEALCSSAAVPMLIGSFKLKTSKYKWFKYDVKTGDKIKFEPEFSKIRIWDGGAYDNLGIEPLVKYNDGLDYRNEINFLIVSDAALEIKTKQRKWYSTNAMRLMDVTSDQIRALRARALWNHFENKPNSGVYFKIGETASGIKSRYKKTNEISSFEFSSERLQELKFYSTNLKKMKESDFSDLFKHGWEVANAALVCQCPDLFNNQTLKH
jgi:NTE family protein